MSILNVEHLTHGFGDRAIFNDVSFRLLKGEHIGLVGANGEGKVHFYEHCYRENCYRMKGRLSGRKMCMQVIWISMQCLRKA